MFTRQGTITIEDLVKKYGEDFFWEISSTYNFYQDDHLPAEKIQVICNLYGSLMAAVRLLGKQHWHGKFMLEIIGKKAVATVEMKIFTEKANHALVALLKEIEVLAVMVATLYSPTDTLRYQIAVKGTHAKIGRRQ